MAVIKSLREFSTGAPKVNFMRLLSSIVKQSSKINISRNDAAKMSKKKFRSLRYGNDQTVTRIFDGRVKNKFHASIVKCR